MEKVPSQREKNIGSAGYLPLKQYKVEAEDTLFSNGMISVLFVAGESEVHALGFLHEERT
jgi:hypothetical protein